MNLVSTFASSFFTFKGTHLFHNYHRAALDVQAGETLGGSVTTFPVFTFIIWLLTPETRRVRECAIACWSQRFQSNLAEKDSRVTSVNACII